MRRRPTAGIWSSATGQAGRRRLHIPCAHSAAAPSAGRASPAPRAGVAPADGHLFARLPARSSRPSTLTGRRLSVRPSRSSLVANLVGELFSSLRRGQLFRQCFSASAADFARRIAKSIPLEIARTTTTRATATASNQSKDVTKGSQ